MTRGRRRLLARRSGGDSVVAAGEPGWRLQPHTLEDLGRCVVMLERTFTETMKMDGADVEVWLNPPGAKRPAPKVARHLASGFFVATRRVAFLVTAAHVARDMDRKTQITIESSGRARSLRLSTLLGRKATAPAWVTHRRADVAVLVVPRPPRVLRGRFFPAELITGRETPPGASVELAAIGFALGLASRKHFAPLTKHVHAASGILRFSGEGMPTPADFFLLDQPSVGGMSGAPVFVIPGGGSAQPPRCVGLISQTIADESGGQFAAVVPSRLIKQVVEKHEQP